VAIDPNDPTNRVLAYQNVGVEFDAIAMMPDRLVDYNTARGVDADRWVYVVGRKSSSTGLADEQVTNMLYWLEPQENQPDDPTDYHWRARDYWGLNANEPPDMPRYPTDVIPVAQLLTSPTIVFRGGSPPAEAAGATDPTMPYGTRGDVEDGDTIRITDADGDELVFEFDSGPDVRFVENIEKPTGVRDGDTFMLNDGDDQVIFEFDSGPVLVIGKEDQGWLGMIDEAMFTIQELPKSDGTPGATFTFEIDTNGALTDATHVGITYDPAAQPNAVLMTDAIVDAINSQSWTGRVTDPPATDTMADYHVYQDPASGDLLGRITLLHDQFAVVNPEFEETSDLEGWYGAVDPSAGFDVIPFEEVMDIQLFGDRVVTAVEGSALDDVRAGYFHRNPPGNWLPFDINNPGTWWYGLQPMDRLTFYHAVDFAFAPRAASAQIRPLGLNNDFIITASQPGQQYNDIDIFFQYSGVAGSDPQVEYDQSGQRLLIQIDPVTTSANDVINAINLANRQWLEIDATATGRVIELQADTLSYDLQTSPLTERLVVKTVSGNAINDQDEFYVFDGTAWRTFEFDTGDGTVGGGRPVVYDANMSRGEIANVMAAAINAVALFNVDPSVLPDDNLALDGRGLAYDLGDTTMSLLPGVRLIGVRGDQLTDEQTFELSDGTNTVVFEFEDTGLNNGLSLVGQLNGYVPVPFSLGDTSNAIAARIADLINTAGVPFVATLDSGEAGNTGAGLVIFDPGNPFNLGLQGTTAGGIQGVPFFQHVTGTEHGIAHSSDVAIPFAADDGGDTVASSITAAVNSGSTYEPAFGVRADRQLDLITLNGVEQSASVVIVQPSPFEVIGEGVGGEITGMAFAAAPDVDGRPDHLFAVTDEGGLYRFYHTEGSSQNPVRYEYLDYGSTPQYGMLPVGQGDDATIARSGLGPQLEYVGPIRDDAGNLIRFSALTAGPRNVEDERYADMLFATDVQGRLFALDTTGKLQPIFLDGATSIQTGVAEVQGIAFSNIDYNLWHRTVFNQPNWHSAGEYSPGIDTVAAGVSYYFGMEDPRHAIEPQAGTTAYLDLSADELDTYKIPGGTYGSLISDTFNLNGYDRADEPTLYFSYYYDTELQDVWDAVRVFISDDGVDWEMIAEGTGWDQSPPNPLPPPPYGTVNVGNRILRNEESSPNQLEWRQARVDLSSYVARADLDLTSLRMRFDFTTGSDMAVGVTMDTGAYYMAIPAAKIYDGEHFTIDAQTFEFDMGYSLLIPNAAGKAIDDGETITLENGAGVAVTFEFDKDGTLVNPLAVPIFIYDDNTTIEVAQKVEYTIRANAPAGVEAKRWESRVSLDGAYNVTVSPGLGWIDLETGLGAGLRVLQGDDPGVTRFNSHESTVIPLNLYMSKEEVADAVALAADQRLTGSRDIIALAGDQFADMMTFTISDGVNTVPLEFNLGYSMEVPLYGGQVLDGTNIWGRNLVDGDWFTLEDRNGNLVRFEFEDRLVANGVLAGSIPIAYDPPDYPVLGDPGDTNDQVLQAVFNQVSAFGPAGTTAYLFDGEIYVEGAIAAFQSRGLEGLGFLRRLPAGVVVADGDWFTLDDDDDPLTPPVVFEFNRGFSMTAPFDGGLQLSDGDYFTVENTLGQVVTYEFNRGFSLDVPAGAAANLQDGDTFAITDDTGATVTYEFDDGFLVDVPLGASADIQDGYWFRIFDALGAATTYEFDEGYRLAVFDNAALDILDGDQITMNNLAGDQITFEFDKGFTLDAPAGVDLNDGWTFDVVDTAGNTVTYEFDTGQILVVPPNPTATVIQDTDSFTVENAAGTTLTFEFEDLSIGDGVVLGNVPVEFNPGDSDLIMAQAIANAMNAYVGTYLPGVSVSLLNNEVHIDGATNITLNGLPPTMLIGGGVAPGHVAVDINVADTQLQVAQEIFNQILVNGPPGVTASLLNDRVHLAGVVAVTPSAGLAALVPPFVVSGNGLISPGADVAIQLDISDTKDIVLQKIFDAINTSGFPGVTPHLNAPAYQIFLEGAANVTVTPNLTTLNMLLGDGVAVGSVPIPFNPPDQPLPGDPGDTEAQLAQKIYNAIVSTPPTGVAPFLRGDEVYLTGASDMTWHAGLQAAPAGTLSADMFFGDGVAAGNVPVPFNPPGFPFAFSPGDSAAQVAQKIFNAVSQVQAAGMSTVVPHLLPADDEVHLQYSDAVTVSPNLGPAGLDIVVGDPPGALNDPAAVEVRFWETDSHEEVVQTMYDALIFGGPAGVVPDLIGDDIHLPGAADVVFVDVAPFAPPTRDLATEMVQGDPAGALNDPTAVEIRFNGSDTRTELVNAILAAINAFGPAGVNPVLLNSVIHLKGATYATQSTGLAFWFTGDALHDLVDGTAVEVRYQLSDDANEIARLLTEAINTANTDPAWTLDVTATQNGILVTLGGRVVFFEPGDTPLALAGNRDLQYMPGTTTPAYTSMKVDEALMMVIGHTVTDPGPLPYDNSLPGDFPPPPWGKYANIRGQRNASEGFFLDDVIIGLAERGEMVSNVTNDNTFNSVGSGGAIVNGAYQLEIRRGTDFQPGEDIWDTNDRLREALTLMVPRAEDLSHADTFTVSDGVNEVVFQFLGRTDLGGLPGSGAGVPIIFEPHESAGAIADRIATAINNCSAPPGSRGSTTTCSAASRTWRSRPSRSTSPRGS